MLLVLVVAIGSLHCFISYLIVVRSLSFTVLARWTSISSGVRTEGRRK